MIVGVNRAPEEKNESGYILAFRTSLPILPNPLIPIPTKTLDNMKRCMYLGGIEVV